MTDRYVAIPPRAWSSESHTPEDRPTCQVFEREDAPIKTGLLNAEGVPLFRMPVRGPLGFCR